MLHTAKYATEPFAPGGFYVLRDGVRELVVDDAASASRVITRLATIDRAASGGGWTGDVLADDDVHVHVRSDSRYVVVLAVGYEQCCAPSPAQAAELALDLTRDGGRGETSWAVYDRHTGEVHQLEQSAFEDSAS